MNEELKDPLKSQGKRMRDATARFEKAKSDLETFDATTRGGVREVRQSTNLKPLNEADTDAAVLAEKGRAPLVAAFIESKADLEGLKADTQCLLAHVSLVCSETAAMSRISQ